MSRDYSYLMKRYLFFFLTLTLSACTSCAHPGSFPWVDDGDRVARENQLLMRHTVAVHTDFLYMTVDQTTKKPELKVWTGGGTGVVIENDLKRSESLVVTAGHVCTAAHKTVLTDAVGGIFPVIDIDLTVESVEGVRTLFRIVFEDEKSDLCFLTSKGIVGIPAPLATDVPPIGAQVKYAGAPLLEFGKWYCPLFDGYFSGAYYFQDIGVSFVVTIPAAGGASGSGVYYRGRLFGIISKVHRGFPNLTYLVHAGHLAEDLPKAEVEWRKNTSPSSK